MIFTLGCKGENSSGRVSFSEKSLYATVNLETFKKKHRQNMKAFQQHAYRRFCSSEEEGGYDVTSCLVSCSFWRRVSGSGGGVSGTSYEQNDWQTLPKHYLLATSFAGGSKTMASVAISHLGQSRQNSGVTTTILLPTLVVFKAMVYSVLLRCWNTCFKFVYFFCFRCWTTVIRRGLCVVSAASRFAMNMGFDAMNGVMSCKTKTESTRASTATRPSLTRGR